jgi:isoquinoline 1-oxidoreductase subunit alpha
MDFKINGKVMSANVEGEMPLLWALRDELNLKGTKYGCGIAQCGAAEITTIEGLAKGGELTKVQKAWIELQVPQCGYCQSGMIMAATKLLKDKPQPTDAEIDAAMTNICRCSTYVRVRQAIHLAAKMA